MSQYVDFLKKNHGAKPSVKKSSLYQHSNQRVRTKHQNYLAVQKYSPKNYNPKKSRQKLQAQDISKSTIKPLMKKPSSKDSKLQGRKYHSENKNYPMREQKPHAKDQNSNIKKERKIPSRLRIQSRGQISLDGLQLKTSLTPKDRQQSGFKESKVHSTKNKQHQEFIDTGLIRFQESIRKKNPRPTEVQKVYFRDTNRKTLTPSHRGRIRTQSQKQVSMQNDEQTLKFCRDAQFDVKAYLTSEQYQKFGQRFPEKFKRVALLGRGGFSVVWLGVHRTGKKKMAIKQILTTNPHETHLKQIWFGSYFFQKGGQTREEFQNHIGINNLCRLLFYEIMTLDTWLYYEVCQNSLGSSLFELQSSENEDGGKIYRMRHKRLIECMRKNTQQLKFLIVEISKALFLINSHNIVHSDLKTENILIKFRRNNDQESPYIQQVKLIDFGSSFLFTNLKQFSMATPQYMPPEILNYILYQNKLEYDSQMLEKMQKYLNPWVIDVWSLGCIVLQIVTGLPLWMSIPTEIPGCAQRVTGLFASKGRIFEKIIQKQIQVVERLQQTIKQKNYSGICLSSNMIGLLSRMLSLDPEKRISPLQILDFFNVPCQPKKIPFY